VKDVRLRQFKFYKLSGAGVLLGACFFPASGRFP